MNFNTALYIIHFESRSKASMLLKRNILFQLSNKQDKKCNEHWVDSILEQQHLCIASQEDIILSHSHPQQRREFICRRFSFLHFPLGKRYGHNDAKDQEKGIRSGKKNETTKQKKYFLAFFLVFSVVSFLLFFPPLVLEVKWKNMFKNFKNCWSDSVSFGGSRRWRRRSCRRGGRWLTPSP